MPARLVPILATVQVLAAGAALANDIVQFCTGCAERSSIAVAGAGTAYYFVLAILAWRGKSDTLVRAMAFIALGVHTGLAAFMIREHLACLFCWIAAGGSLLLAIAAWVPKPRALALPVLSWPFGAAAAFALLPLVTATGYEVRPDIQIPVEAITNVKGGEIVVFVFLRCHACESFMATDAAGIEADYGKRDVKIRYAFIEPVTNDPFREKIQLGSKLVAAAGDEGKFREAFLAVYGIPWTNFTAEECYRRLADLVTTEKLRTRAESPEADARLKADFALARAIHLQHTPSFLVRAAGSRKGTLGFGQTGDDLRAFLDRALAGKEPR